MEYNPSDEEHQQIIQHLLEEGAARFEGLDDDGEPIYSFDMEILEEIMPELHQVMQDDMDNILVDLYQKGLIEVEYDEDLNAKMNISEEGKMALLDAGFDLDGSEEEDF
jgi:hypothetical protein